MSIEPHLFPIPESAYATNGVRFDALFPHSLIAWNLELTTAKGNLYHAERKRGYYFYRDSQVPMPRPATQLTWERLVRLGDSGSRAFLVPFLPSLRDEDEMGQAIAERGIKLASLGRRSPLHQKEIVRLTDGQSFESIVWGDVFLGQVGKDPSLDSVLCGKIDRSNVPESLVAPRRFIYPETAQDSIRLRMEFIAQYGVPALYQFSRKAQVPVAHRILFQFLDQASASRWALAYAMAWKQIRDDPGLIMADYAELVHSIHDTISESERAKKEADLEKNSKKGGGKQDFSSIEL